MSAEPNNIISWMDSGNEGMLFAQMDYDDYLGIFNRDDKTIFIIDMSNLNKCPEEDQGYAEKLMNIFEKIGPIVQAKMLKVFPELEALQ